MPLLRPPRGHALPSARLRSRPGCASGEEVGCSERPGAEPRFHRGEGMALGRGGQTVLKLAPLALIALPAATSANIRIPIQKLKAHSLEHNHSAPKNVVQTESLPKPGPNITAFQVISAKESSRNGSTVKAEGNVHFRFKGYEVWADKVSGDLDTQVFTLEGAVRVVGSDREVKGQRVVVDFDLNSVQYDEAWVKLTPLALGGSIKGDLFVRGRVGGGTNQRLELQNSKLTTCEYDHPHWELESRGATIRPGKYAVLRGTKFRLFDKTILTLPLLYIPLNERGDRYTPEIGQTQDEGYFIKNRIGLALKGESFLINRLDYFSKLGAGIGTDWHYGNPTMAGIARAYSLPGRTRTALLGLDHRMRVGNVGVRIDGNFIRNNYLAAPNNRTYSLRSAISVPTAVGALNLSVNRNGNRTSGFSSLNQVFGLQHSGSWNRGLTTSLQTDLTENKSGSGGNVSSRRVANVNFRGNQDLSFAQAQLEYQRLIPVGRQVGFFSGSDRTPMVTLSSDSSKLLGEKAGRSVPFRTALSVGELVDSLTRKKITRQHFELGSNLSRRDRRGSSLQTALRFRQGLYSDDTAQYVIDGNLAMSYAVSEGSSVNLRYNYLNPFGYTPLSIDRTGRSHDVGGDISLRLRRDLNVGVQTGYDFLQLDRKTVAWQNVGVRADFTPNRKLTVRSSANYDPFNQWWSNVRFDVGWNVAEGFLSAGFRYDGPRARWANINILADSIRWKRLKTSALINFNGYSNRVEAIQLAMTYDLHCAEAVLQYSDYRVGFRSGREIGLFVWLKALPFGSPFGIGRRGQGLGTGTGFGP